MFSFLAALEAGKGAIDEAKDAQNEQLKTELAVKKAMDELTATITGPVLTGFKLLLTGVMYLGKAMAWIVKHMPGGKDITHLFRTPEELQEEIKNIATDIRDLENELVKATEIQKQKNKVTEDLNKKEKELEEAKNKATQHRIFNPAGKSKEELADWEKEDLKLHNKPINVKLENSVDLLIDQIVNTVSLAKLKYVKFTLVLRFLIVC
jgi:hypothetical protein